MPSPEIWGVGRTLSAKTTALTAVNIGTAHIRSPTTRPGRRWQNLQRSLRCRLGLGNRPTLIVVHGRSRTDDRQSCLAVDSTVTVSTPAPSNAVLPSNVSDIPPLFGQEPLTKKAMGPCPPPSPFASLVRAAVIATDLVSPWRTRLTRAGPSSSDRGAASGVSYHAVLYIGLSGRRVYIRLVTKSGQLESFWRRPNAPQACNCSG